MCVWVGVLPFVFLPNLKYIAIGVCIVIAYSLLGMEGICLEIEMPFGRDFNDLPIDKLAMDAIMVGGGDCLELGWIPCLGAES